MPTYDYECAKCGEVFEVFQSMKAEALKKHEGCGGKVRRLISGGAGIIFKGSGFYETDYKRKPMGSTGPDINTLKASENKDFPKDTSKPKKETKPESKKKASE